MQITEWAELVGAPDDARVDVAAANSNGGPAVEIRMHHRWLEGPAIRFVYRDAAGRLATRNEHLHIRDDAPEGVGTRIFAHQVRKARLLGIVYLSAEAAGGPGSTMVGYSVWPKFGFNGAIPPSVRRKLPPEYQDAGDVLDLLSRPGGFEWWQRHGRGFEATFDLRNGSLSLATLAAYTDRRGVRI